MWPSMPSGFPLWCDQTKLKGEAPKSDSPAVGDFYIINCMHRIALLVKSTANHEPRFPDTCSSLNFVTEFRQREHFAACNGASLNSPE